MVRAGDDLILFSLGRKEWRSREEKGQSSSSLQGTEMFTHLNEGKIWVVHVLQLENLKSFSLHQFLDSFHGS